MRKSDMILGATALLLFLAAFFVVPLCVAMTLCAMPCCAASHEIALVGGSPCASECAVSASGAQAPDVKVTKIAAPPALSPDASAEPEVIVRPSIVPHDEPPPVGVPLHLLHATFLI